MSNYKNNKQDMEAGRRAIREVARREGISEAEVRAELEFSIREAYDLNNPMWANSPFTDGVPTPEEFIIWTAELVRKETSESYSGSCKLSVGWYNCKEEDVSYAN